MKLTNREKQLIEECKNADEQELRQLVAKLAKELEQQPDQRLAKALDRLAEAIENQRPPIVIPATYSPYKITWESKPYIAPYDPTVRVFGNANPILISGNSQ